MRKMMKFRSLCSLYSTDSEFPCGPFFPRFWLVLLLCTANLLTVGIQSGLAQVPNAYCKVSYNPSTGVWIQSFKISAGTLTGGYAYKSSGNNGGYADFTATVFSNLQRNASYVPTITRGTTLSPVPLYGYIWIDLNQDKDFTDAGELVYSGGPTTSASMTGAFKIPSSALTGVTRMRVILTAFTKTPPDPCALIQLGEAEDYTIQITNSLFCDSRLNASFEWLNFVGVADNAGTLLSNNSGNDNGQGLFTHLQVNLLRDKAYTVTFKRGYLQNNTLLKWGYAVWIDFNQDGDFADAGEKVLSVNPDSASTVTASFYVPLNTLPGYARMRVIMKRGSVPGEPCELYTTTNYGEVEDYSVRVYPNTSYCTGKGTSSNLSWIDKVSIGTINNTSGNNGGYGNFTNQVATLAKPHLDPYEIIIIRGRDPFYSLTYGCAVWIDYNKDMDFNDPGELVFTSSPSLNLKTVGKFYLPSTASLGYTRMRVAIAKSAVPGSPCNTTVAGEVEDYCVNIIASPDGSPEPVSVWEESAPGPVVADSRSVEPGAGSGSLLAYPIPARTEVRIKWLGEDVLDGDLLIFDVNGNLRKTVSISGMEAETDVSDLPSGLYFIRADRHPEIPALRLVKIE